MNSSLIFQILVFNVLLSQTRVILPLSGLRAYLSDASILICILLSRVLNWSSYLLVFYPEYLIPRYDSYIPQNRILRARTLEYLLYSSYSSISTREYSTLVVVLEFQLSRYSITTSQYVAADVTFCSSVVYPGFQFLVISSIAAACSFCIDFTLPYP